MRNLAIIPARGGSKRIPKKNLRDFCGQPIIKYSIDIAKSSELFDVIMVSTDDEAIRDFSVGCGVEVPFMRSQESANDQSSLTDVVLEVISDYTALDMQFVNICLLLPTAPLASVDRLSESFYLLEKGLYSSVVPVVKFSYPIQRALVVDEFMHLSMMYPENTYKRSQDLRPAFHDAGQFYWLKQEAFLKERAIFMQNTGCIELDELSVQDIDTEIDWKIAEMKYHFKSKSIVTQS